MDQFNMKISELFENHNNKMILVCGDFIVFGGVRAKCDIKLYSNGAEIARLHETKFLRVIIDHELCLRSHIE